MLLDVVMLDEDERSRDEARVDPDHWQDELCVSPHLRSEKFESSARAKFTSILGIRLVPKFMPTRLGLCLATLEVPPHHGIALWSSFCWYAFQSRSQGAQTVSSVV